MTEGVGFPAAVKAEAVNRYVAGESASVLAREYGTTRQTVLRWVREASPGASRPMPEPLRRAEERRPPDLGDGDGFWSVWEGRQRELAAQEGEAAPEAETAPVVEEAATEVSAEGAFKLSLLPWLLIGMGGASLGKGIASVLKRGA